jgi:hypothetical protein
MAARALGGPAGALRPRSPAQGHPLVRRPRAFARRPAPAGTPWARPLPGSGCPRCAVGGRRGRRRRDPATLRLPRCHARGACGAQDGRGRGACCLHPSRRHHQVQILAPEFGPSSGGPCARSAAGVVVSARPRRARSAMPARPPAVWCGFPAGTRTRIVCPRPGSPPCCSAP